MARDCVTAVHPRHKSLLRIRDMHRKTEAERNGAVKCDTGERLSDELGTSQEGESSWSNMMEVLLIHDRHHN